MGAGPPAGVESVEACPLGVEESVLAGLLVGAGSWASCWREIGGNWFL